MKRINVIGTSGSGKSTFSQCLAQRLNSDYIEMDSLFWQADWTESTDEEFFPKLKQALAADCWVLDGNYTRTRDIKWQRVDTVIWIDFGFSRTLWQLLKRTINRSWKRQELWPGTGNTESFYKSFISRDSIILWMLSHYFGNKKRYAQVMTDKQFNRIQFIRLTSPKDASIFLNKFFDTTQTRRKNVDFSV